MKRKIMRAKRQAMVLSIATAVLGGAFFSPVNAQNARVAAADAAKAANPISFNFGLVTADQYAVYVAQDLGLFAKHGLKPNFTPFQNGALLLAALKSESIDVTSIGMATVFALGQGIKLKVIAWDVNSSPAVALVSNQNEVKSYRDIEKAGKIGVATGSCVQVAMYYLAKAVNVPYDKLDIVNIPPSQARNAMHGGAIQSSLIWAPYSFQAVEAGSRIVNFTTDWPPAGGFCPSMVVARDSYVAAHPEVGKRLIAVQADALKAIEKNPDVAIKALQNRLSVTEEVAKQMFERVWKQRPTYAQQLDPNSPYSLVAPTGLASILKRGSDAFAALKVLPKPVEPSVIDAAIDPSFIRAYLETSK